MNFLKNLHKFIKKPFKKIDRESEVVDEVQEKMRQHYITAYRKMGAELNQAPTEKTSDQKIIEIYNKVFSAFREAGKQRGEHIPASYLNFIVIKFYNIYEMAGEEFLDEHLEYEINRYLNRGLRSDYKKKVYLF